MEYLQQLSSDSEDSQDFLSLTDHSPSASIQGPSSLRFFSPSAISVTSDQAPDQALDKVPVQMLPTVPATQTSNLRRSKRLRPQDAPPDRLFWKDWPMNKLIKTLLKNGNAIPAGSDRESLFILYCNSISAEPVFPPKKHNQPRPAIQRPKTDSRQSIPDLTTPTISTANQQPAIETQHSQIFNEIKSFMQPFSDTLSSVSSQLSDLEKRVSVMEQGKQSTVQSFISASNTAAPPTASYGPALISASEADPPIYNLATASTYGSSSPTAARRHTISPQIRRVILEGKDINLVSLLMTTSEFLDHRVVDCGDLAVTLKSRDPRLLKNLTLGEFVLAFSIFRDVLCSVYPNRRAELESYEYYIVELSVRYGGTMFYEYHKAFSAKAAAILAADNHIVNWAKPDPDLFNRIFGGLRANACGVCASTAHSTALCPKAAIASTSKAPGFAANSYRSSVPNPIHSSAPLDQSTRKDKYGRSIRFSGGRQICNNFNTGFCSNRQCNFIHMCSNCGDAHANTICPLKRK